MFELVCPSGADDICSCRTGDQFPSLVLHDRLVLGVHCPLPLSAIFPIQNILVMHRCFSNCHRRKECCKSTLPEVPSLRLTSGLPRSLILIVLRERWRRSGNSRSSWNRQYLNLCFC